MKGIGGVQGRPARFVLAVLSVVLGVGMLSGAFIAHSSVTSTLSGVVDTVTGADAYVVPQGSSVVDALVKPAAEQHYLDSSIATQISSVAEVQGSLQVYMGSAILEDHDKNEISSGLAASVALPADPNEVEGGRIVEGELPSTIEQVVIEQNLAQKAGLNVGDTINILANGTELEPVISGIVAYDTPLDGTIVLILYGIAARAIYSPSGMIPFVAVKAQDGVTPDQLKDALSAAVSTDANAEVLLGSDVRAQAMTQINNSLAPVSLALFVIGVAMMLIGGFLVFNIFSTAERSRTEEIAALKSMGATTSDVLKPVVTQSLVIALIGSVIGIIGGYGLAAIGEMVMSHMDLATTMVVPWFGMVISIIAGIVVTMLAARWGALQVVSKVGIDEADDLNPRTGFGAVRMIVGVILILAGAAGIVLGHSDGNNVWFVGLGALAALAGVVFVGPVLVAGLAWLFSFVLRLFSPVPAGLAKASIIRRPRRAGNVAGIFIVVLGLAVASFVLASSASAAYASTLDKEVSADLVLTPKDSVGIIPDTVVAKVRQIPNVQVYAFGEAPMKIVNDTDARVMFGPSEAFTSASADLVLDGDANGFATGAAVTKAYADSHGLKIGDTIDFVIAGTTPYQADVSLPVAVIIDSTAYRDVMVSYSWLIQQVPGHTRSQLMPVTFLYASASESGSGDSIYDPVVAAVSTYLDISVQHKDDFVSTEDVRVTQAKIVAYVLAALCVIIAILALVNTLNKAAGARAGEIRVLRAYGMARGQIRTMIRFESLLIAIAGSVVGILVGVGLALTALLVLPLGVTTLTLGWIWIVVVFVVSLIAALVAAIGPASRASRTSAYDLAV